MRRLRASLLSLTLTQRRAGLRTLESRLDAHLLICKGVAFDQPSRRGEPRGGRLALLEKRAVSHTSGGGGALMY